MSTPEQRKEWRYLVAHDDDLDVEQELQLIAVIPLLLDELEAAEAKAALADELAAALDKEHTLVADGIGDRGLYCPVCALLARYEGEK